MDASSLEKGRLKRAESSSLLPSFESPNDETSRMAAQNHGEKDMTKAPSPHHHNHEHHHRRGGGGGGGGGPGRSISDQSNNHHHRSKPQQQRECESVTDTEAYTPRQQRQARRPPADVNDSPSTTTKSRGIARSRSERNLSFMQQSPNKEMEKEEEGELETAATATAAEGVSSRLKSSDRNHPSMLTHRNSPKRESSFLEQRLEAGSNSAATSGVARDAKSVMSVQRQRRRHPSHHPHLKSRSAGDASVSSNRTSLRGKVRKSTSGNDGTDRSVSTVRTDVGHLRGRRGPGRSSFQHQANGPDRNPRPRQQRAESGGNSGSSSSVRGRVPVDKNNEYDDDGRSPQQARRSKIISRPSSSPDRTTTSSNNHSHERPKSRSRRTDRTTISSNDQLHERPRSRSRGREPSSLTDQTRTSSNQQHERPRSRSRGRLSKQDEQKSASQYRPRSQSRERRSQEEQKTSNNQRPRSKSREKRSQEVQETSNNQRPRSKSRERRSQEEQETSNNRRPRSKSRERRSREEKQQNNKVDKASNSPAQKEADHHRHEQKRMPDKSPRPDFHCAEEPSSENRTRRTQPSSPRRCFRTRVSLNKSNSPRQRNTSTSEKASPSTYPDDEHHISIPSLDHVQTNCEETTLKPLTQSEDSSKLIFKGSKSMSTEPTSESSSDEEGSTNSNGDNGDNDSDDGTVLQFDPSQASSVYRVQQVSNAGSSCQVKNFDGTFSDVQIAEIVDHIGEAQQHQGGGALKKNEEQSPIFDFLEDQDTYPHQAGEVASPPRMPTRRLSTQPPPSPDRAAIATTLEEGEEQLARPQPQRDDNRSHPKTRASHRNPERTGASGLRKKRPPCPDRQPGIIDNSQELTSNKESSGRRRQAPKKAGSENSAARNDPDADGVMTKILSGVGDTTEKQPDAPVNRQSSNRRIVGDAKNYSHFFSSTPRTAPSTRESACGSGGFHDSLTSLGAEGYSVGHSVGIDGMTVVSEMNPPSLTEDEQDSPIRTKPRLRKKIKKPQHGPHGTPVVRKPRTLATRDTERSPNSESEFSDAQHSQRERRSANPIAPLVDSVGGIEEGRQTNGPKTAANDRDPCAEDPTTPGKLQAQPVASDCEGAECTPVTSSNKKSLSKGLATSIGRYFSSGGGRRRRSGSGTDAESSGWESEGSGSVLASPGSRLFARKKVIQHQLLGDDSSSYESSLGSCGMAKIRT